MIGDVALDLLASESNGREHPRAMLNLEQKPFEINDFPFTNLSIKYTNFRYDIKCSPNSKVMGMKDKIYLIKADIIRGTYVRVKDIVELRLKAKTDKGIAWLLEWTNLGDPNLWSIANCHRFFAFPLNIDLVGYEKHIKSQFPQAGRNYPVFFERGIAMQIAKEKDEYFKDRIKEEEKTIYDD